MRGFAFSVSCAVASGSLALASSAFAQAGRPMTPLELSTACAPPAATDRDQRTGLKIIGAQDPAPRSLYGERDLLLVNGGRFAGLRVNQQFIIRRRARIVARDRQERLAITTVGALRILSMNDTMSLAMVDYACTGISQNDYLIPYTPPAVPADADRAVNLMTLDFESLDFSSMARVLRSADDKLTGAVGDYLMIDRGAGQGVAPGKRFAVYRDLISPTLPMASGGQFAVYNNRLRAGLPLAPIGEVIVISAGPNTSLVRVTLSRDAVQYGDYLVPRKSDSLAGSTPD